jgi:hypothetical protein
MYDRRPPGNLSWGDPRDGPRSLTFGCLAVAVTWVAIGALAWLVSALVR